MTTESSADESLYGDGRGNSDRKVDWLLALLVNMVDTNLDFRVGVTLTVRGAVVTGQLISATRYFELFASKFGEGFQNEETGKGIAGVFQEYGAEARAAAARNTSELGFVHLVNTQHLSPGAPGLPTASDGILWRGRLSEVSGFMLGTIS